MSSPVATLNSQVIEKLIPPEFHQYVTVQMISLPNNPNDFIDAFRDALKLIAKLFTDPKPIVITVGTSPFVFDSDKAKTTVEFINGTEQLTTGNRIFLNWKFLESGTKEFQTAVILEELCHCMFNIADEDLVRTVVCHIYQKVVWNEKEYEKK